MESREVNTAGQEAKYRLLFYCTQAVSKSHNAKSSTIKEAEAHAVHMLHWLQWEV